MKIRSTAFCVMTLLTACGPMSPEAAARQCEEKANAAAGPTGELEIGINNRGKVGGGVEFGVTSDYLRGRDPFEVYEECVIARSGQPPIRPLELRPGLLR